MLIAIVPVLAALLGLLLWGFAPGDAKTAGKILFAAGTLVTVYVLAGHTVRIG